MVASKPNLEEAHTKLIERLTKTQLSERRRNPFVHILADCISPRIAETITFLQLDFNVQSRLCQVSHFVSIARKEQVKDRSEAMRMRILDGTMRFCI